MVNKKNDELHDFKPASIKEFKKMVQGTSGNELRRSVLVAIDHNEHVTANVVNFFLYAITNVDERIKKKENEIKNCG